MASQVSSSLGRLGFLGGPEAETSASEEETSSSFSKRLWIEKMTTPQRLDEADHPLGKTMWGPFLMQVDTIKDLMDNVLPAKGEIYSIVFKMRSYTFTKLEIIIFTKYVVRSEVKNLH